MKRSPEFTRLADHVWHSIEREVRASISLEQLAEHRSGGHDTDIGKE